MLMRQELSPGAKQEGPGQEKVVGGVGGAIVNKRSAAWSPIVTTNCITKNPRPTISTGAFQPAWRMSTTVV